MSRTAVFASNVIGSSSTLSFFKSKNLGRFITLSLIFLLSLQTVWGQLSITTAGTTINQTFDGLTNTGTGLAATGGIFSQGWSFLEGGTNANATYQAGTGSGNGGDTYSFGATSATDRTFGMLQSGSLTSILGFKFTNNTGLTISSITVGYTGEVWRRSAAADNLAFSYQSGDVALNAATGWTTVSGLAFATPVTGTAAALDGNLAANRSVITPVTITGLSIANGATFTLRWVDGTGSSSAGFGIDDFSILLVNPATAPLAPTISAITPSNGQLSVAFTAGGNGGSAITNYAYSTDNGSTFTDCSPAQTTSPIVITGLTNGTAYNVKIRAINTIGNGTASAAVSATPATTAGAPAITGITAGNTTLSVAFTAPSSTGGAAITNYKYSTNNGSSFVAVSPAQTTSPIVISGLTNGVTYDVQLLAVNAQGDGAASTSVQGTPVAPSSPSIVTSGSLAALTATYGSASSTTSFSVSGSALTDDILITVPAGFEVSQTAGGASGYAATQTLTQSSGTVANTTIYVRLAAGTAAGSYAGDVVASSTGATSENLTIPSSTVNQLALTISGLTANGKQYDGQTTTTLSGTATLNGVVGLDDVNLSGTPVANFTTKNVGTAKPVTVTGYTLSGTSAGNYTLDAITGLTADVTVAPLTITGATAANKTYDGTKVAAVSGGTFTTVYGLDDVALSAIGVFADSNVANGIAVTVSIVGADIANYSFTQPSVTADITPANQSITFNAISTKTTFAADFAPGATSATSATNAITYTSSNTAVATIVAGNIHIVGSGTTTITASQAASLNYNAATDVSQTLTVLEGLLAWDFTGEGTTTNNTSTADFSSTALNGGSVLSRGAGAAWSGAGNSFRTVGFQNNGISTANTDYFQFSFTPVAGKVVSLSTLDARFSGTTTFAASPGVSSQFAYSFDGSTYTLIGASPIITIGSPATLPQVDLTGVSALQNISSSTTVYFRYYASGQTTTGGWGFNSSAAGVFGLSLGGVVSAAPTVTTPTATGITNNSATLGATVTSDGGSTISERGTVYGTSAAPTGNGLAEGGTSIASFSHERTGLSPNTLYYYRGYAVNGAGTGYSADNSFYTLANIPGAPTVGNATSITLDVALDVNGNPAATVFAIQETTSGNYVQANGNLSATPVWQTAATWGATITVNGLTSGDTYTFHVKARNADGVETDFGGSTSGTTSTIATPFIFTSGVPVALTTTYGSVSSTTSFSVSATALTEDLSIVAPAGFEISQTPGGTSGFATSQIVTQTAGEISAVTIYIRLALSNAGTYSGSVQLSSTGATTVNVSVPASLVEPKVLTITGISISNKDYDRTTAATINGSAALSGIVGTDDVTLTGTPSAVFATANAAANKPVTVSGYLLAGTANTNYSLTQPQGLTATINQKALTISGATAVSKMFDGNTNATIVGTLSGVISPDVVTLSGTGTFASAAVGTNIAVTSTSTLTGAAAANYTINPQPTGLVANIIAQLSVGDLSIVGFNFNGTDNFAFVPWVSIDTGVLIKFTDNGFLSSASANAAGNGRGGENFVIWKNTSGSSIAAGTVITISGITATVGTASAGSASGLNGLTSGGDNIFVYQGSATSGANPDWTANSNPTTFNGKVLFGLYTQGTSAVTTWLSSGTAAAGTSYLPSELNVTNGNISFSGNTTHGQYTGTRNTLSTLAAYKALVNDPANWAKGTGTTLTISLNSTAFTAATNYTITATAGAGGAISPTGASSVVGGTSATYTITTEGCNTIEDVLVDGVSQGPIDTYTFTNISADHSISVTFTPSTLTIWTGSVNNDFNNAANWSCGLPNSGVDAVILNGGNPVLSANAATRALNIQSGGTVSLGSFSLEVNANVSGNGTITGSTGANLAVATTSSLRFTTGGQVLKNLTINGGTTTLVTPLTITAGTAANTFGTVTVADGASLASDGNLTLQSNIYGTARVASGAIAGNYITGEVTVERYIPQNYKRAWRLLSVPTKGSQTIHQAWQENQGANINGTPGYGTIITGSLATIPLNVAAGFDAKTNSPSIQNYSSASQTWNYLTSTNTGAMQTNRGYFLYIRGDRSILPSYSINATSATTLRTKGVLYQGNSDAGTITVQPGKWEAVGNVFASAVDWTLLQKTGGLSNTFYLWDPKAGSSTTLGAYQTFSPLSGLGQGGYVPLLPGSYGAGTLADPFVSNKLIESGQAFMVTASGSAGSVTLVEGAKVAGSGRNVFRPSSPADIQQFKTNLISLSSSGSTLVDGNLVVFDDAFSNAVDGNDAPKFSNPGENLGLVRNNQKLVIEARQRVNSLDTVYFEIWNMNALNYRLEFQTVAMNIPGLTAYLKDAYLNTTTPIDLSGANFYYDFGVNSQPLSHDINRFKVVFTQAATGPLPVNFISVAANRTGAAVKVDWKVAGERGISRYEVERSANGRDFARVGTVSSNGADVARDLDYIWLDAAPLSGTSFYRVKSVGVNGEVKFTNIVKVQLGAIKPAFAISPNPAEGGVANILFTNQPAGQYQLRILSMDGKLISSKSVNHVGGNSTQVLQLPSVVTAGQYQIEVINSEKVATVQSLLVR